MLEAAASVPGVTHTALSPRFVSALLYGVEPYDPATIAEAITTLTAIVPIGEIRPKFVLLIASSLDQSLLLARRLLSW